MGTGMRMGNGDGVREDQDSRDCSPCPRGSSAAMSGAARRRAGAGHGRLRPTDRWAQLRTVLMQIGSGEAPAASVLRTASTLAEGNPGLATLGNLAGLVRVDEGEKALHRWASKQMWRRLLPELYTFVTEKFRVDDAVDEVIAGRHSYRSRMRAVQPGSAGGALGAGRHEDRGGEVAVGPEAAGGGREEGGWGSRRARAGEGERGRREDIAAGGGPAGVAAGHHTVLLPHELWAAVAAAGPELFEVLFTGGASNLDSWWAEAEANADAWYCSHPVIGAALAAAGGAAADPAAVGHGLQAAAGGVAAGTAAAGHGLQAAAGGATGGTAAAGHGQAAAGGAAAACHGRRAAMVPLGMHGDDCGVGGGHDKALMLSWGSVCAQTSAPRGGGGRGQQGRAGAGGGGRRVRGAGGGELPGSISRVEQGASGGV